MLVKSFILLPFLLLTITMFGTIGFMQIEGWSFLDSLYMTVITLTTIGYHEVQALSDTGKVFNLVLIMFGVGTVTFSITKIISDITSIDFRTRRREKMKKKIESMSGHTIVCGYGRMGEVICKRLAEYNIDFVVIERDPGLIEELNKSNYLHIDGDAANDDHMLEAGIERAKSLVSVIDNDSDGLYIALAARSINPHLFIIVRANEEKARKRILRAGANKVILPFVMSGNKVADTVINPATEDLFDITSAKECDPKEKIELADLIVRESSTITGKTLNEVGPLMPNLLIIGIKNDDEGFEFKPGSTHVFQAGECLIAMGPRKDYENAKAVLNLG